MPWYQNFWRFLFKKIQNFGISRRLRLSSFIWGMIACPTLRNSPVTYREVQVPLVFSSLQYCCFAYCFCLSCACLNQVTSTFWSVTQSLHGGEQATIPHMEEDSQSFHMIPNAQIFISEITLIRANYTFICVAPRTHSSSIIFVRYPRCLPSTPPAWLQGCSWFLYFLFFL